MEEMKIDGLSMAEVEKEIAKNEDSIAKLKKIIDSFLEKKAKLIQDQALRLEKLKAEYESQLNTVYEESNKIDTTIKKLSNKIAKFSDAYKSEQEEYAKDIQSLLDKRKTVYDKRGSLARQEYEKTKSEIEKKIERIRKKKEVQTEEYNKSIISLDEAFVELRKKQEIVKEKALEDRQRVDEDFNKRVQILEDEKAALNKKHEDNLKELEAYKEEVSLLALKKEEILNASKETLKGVYNELKKTTEALDSKNKELNQKSIELDREFDLQSATYVNEINSIKKNNESLNNTLSSKKEELESIKGAITDINAKRENVQAILRSLKNNVERKEEEIKEKVKVTDEELEAKYDAFIQECEEKQKKIQDTIDKQLESLNYCLKKEEEQFENHANFLKERYQNKESEYRRVVDNLDIDNKELAKKTAELTFEYNVRISDMKHELEALSASNAAAIENKEKEMRDKKLQIENEYKEKKKEIDNETEGVNINIANVKEQIKSIEEDFERYKRNDAAKRVDLDKKHADEMNALELSKTELIKNIERLNQEIKNVQKANEEAIQEIENQDKDNHAAYEENINNLNREFKCELVRLEEINRIKILDAKQAHEQKIKELEDLATIQKQKMADESEEIKKSYEQSAEKIQNLEAELAQEFENRREKLIRQREELSTLIEETKAHFDDELKNFNKQSSELEQNQINAINKLKEENAAQIAAIIKEYETLPNEELDKVNEAYSKMLSEYDVVRKDVNAKRKNIENDFNNLVLKNEKIKNDAKASLDATQKAYDEKESEKAAIVAELEKELAAKQAEMTAFNDQLNAELEKLRKNHEEEIEKLDASLLLQYEETKNLLQDKQDIVARQHEQEISAKNKELDDKKNDFNNLIEQAKLHKQKVESEYQNRYAEEQAKTSALQKSFDELKADGDFKRCEWDRLIKVKEETNANEIAAIKDANAEVLDKMRADYDKYIRETNEKINAIRQDTTRLENEKDNMINELGVYQNDKKIEIENIKNTVNAYVNDVNHKLADISDKEAILISIHEERVKTLKKQIADIIINYGDLEKLRPNTINETIERNKEAFIIQAEDFKNKLSSLEKENAEIINKLNTKREVTLKQIENDIKAYINDRNSNLEAHNRDIEELTNNYEALILDEVNKQRILETKVNEANEENAKSQAAFDKRLDSLVVSLKQDKESIEQAFNDSQIVMQKDFNELSARIENELTGATKARLKVSDDLMKIKTKFDEIDQAINLNRDNLMNDYHKNFVEISRLYQNAVNDRKKQYKNSDVLKENILDIFKH